jgi:tight adherence protein C
MGTPTLVFLVIAAIGVGLVGVTLARARSAATDIGEFFEGLDYLDDAESVLDTPFVPRVLGGIYRGFASRIERLVPSTYVAKVRHQLAQAGMSQQRKAGEHLAIQLGLMAIGGIMIPFLPPGTPISGGPAALILPAMGFMVPNAGLKRKAAARADAIFKDLPDIVDMLAIAVEAGSGFESALSIVCQNFKSPLTDELAIALQEMELGLPRKQALQELRDRVDIDIVRTLVLALLQADALGIPIGRVLKSQALEVRARRRAWAREKAAKLPIKIMFPLVLFIFPPIMGLVVGPAFLSFGKLGGG